MSDKSTQEVENAPQLMGHITTPVYNILRVKEILEPHGVTVIDCGNNDNWYTLVLPVGSKAINEGIDSFCTVTLPDGYEFKYLPPKWKNAARRTSRSYDRLPEIEVRS